MLAEDTMQIKVGVQLLLNGTDGTAVVAQLLKEQKSTAAVNTAMNRIRNAVYATNFEPDEYDDSELRTHEDEPGVAAFLNSNLKTKVKLQKRHAITKTWSPEAEVALAGLELLPRSMSTFRLDDTVNRQMKKDRTERLRIKNSTMLKIQAAELIELAKRALERASPTSTISDLALSLLVVSGRRTSEILSGASRFEPTGHPNTALFHGQLKKPNEVEPYRIPLLVPFATFRSALQVLRAKQKSAILDPQACNAKYSSLLNRRLERFRIPQLLAHSS